MMGVVGNKFIAASSPTKHRHRTGPHHLGDAQGQGGFEDVDGALTIHLYGAQRVPPHYSY